MPYEALPFPFPGTIDADGHVLEPADLWETHLEERYRARAIRIGTNDDGFEFLEIDGKPAVRTRPGSLGMLGAMGEEMARLSPDRKYNDHIPYGGGDASERVELADRENLEKVLLYPTLGLLWEAELEDPELSLAYARAYNRWIADFCRDTKGRLVPIAHVSLLDVEGAATELERAVKDGCRGAFVAPFNHNRKAHGHPDHDPLFAKACELDVPIAIHPTIEPTWAVPIRFKGLGMASEFFYNTMLRQGAQQSLLSFFAYGTLERFPTLKLGVLESGCGWAGAFLDRIDAIYETNLGRTTPLKRPPSEYFRRQCFISGDPDETAAPLIMDHVGAECFMWATDYPHPDHPSTWVPALERFVALLSAKTRAAFLGENVKRIYGLS
ncbi:MAG: amidohydrolase family protein [Candidatus Binatia bacterium]|nr:amidohydrolase family protein [Candidatus Binatia bacterium]